MSNKPLKKELVSIWQRDQNIRSEWSDAVKEHGIESNIADSLFKVMSTVDSIHSKRISEIIDQYGWLSVDEVGKLGNNTLFVVIQHSDLATQQKYLPVMRTASTEGKTQKDWLALLEDRVALGEGRKQIYGSQIYFNKNTGTYYVAPLLDPVNVDKRRRDVDLDSMAHYLKNWNLKWNAIEYERKLLEMDK